jgi:hypothetical protein
MKDYSTTKLSRMGRRRFLRSLAGLGISGTAVQYMSQDALASVTDNPKKEVPRLSRLEHANPEAVRAGEEPPKYEPVYYTIPRDKWVRVESAHDAANRLEKRFEPKIDTDYIKFGVTTITTGQRKKKAVVVEHRTVDKRFDGTREPSIDYEQLSELVPEKIDGQAGKGSNTVTVEGIPTTIKKRTVEEQAYFDSKYRPVPGGCQVEDESDDDIGTLCTPAWDSDVSEYVLLTAAHLTEESPGHDMHQPHFSLTAGNYMGDSDKGLITDSFDAATIQMGSDEDNTYRLAGSSSNTYQEWISGTVAWDEIKDNEDNTSYELYLQGRTTGRNSGYIDDAYTDKTYWIDVAAEGGDSGGPHFKLQNGDAYISGVHDWGSSDNDAGATYIGKVEDKFNLSV